MATASEGKAHLAAEDDFTRALGGFERSLRMKRTDAVPDAEYRRFAGEQALDFTADEKIAWAAAIEEVRRGTEGLELGLPPVVLIIKTSGREELDAAYTRGHAIILPAKMAAWTDGASRVGLLAHELFHVSSRTSPPLRDKRYALLAFKPMARAIASPREIEGTRLTNPDAFGRGHYLRVAGNDGAEHAVVPLLTCDIALEKAIATEAWFKSLHVVLVHVVLVEVDPEKATAMVDTAGRTRMLDTSATDWAQRLGQNTAYILHPEEVLAENFALIVRRRLGHAVTVKQPDFLDAFESALRR
jgi:hypothetical protein